MTIDLDDPIALMLVAAAALERSGTECAAYGGLALGIFTPHSSGTTGNSIALAVPGARQIRCVAFT